MKYRPLYLSVILTCLAGTAPAFAQDAPDLVRADFQSLGSSSTAGVYGDGLIFACGDDTFDYVDANDSDTDCGPDPGDQTGTNVSNVSGGGRWHLRVSEQDFGANPRTIKFDFSGNDDPVACQRLNDELTEMGYPACGCSQACYLHAWITADRLFKKNAKREVLSRFDIVEVGGLDGADGPDLRIDYHDDLYICPAANTAYDEDRDGDPDWRVLQTGPCGGDVASGSLADVIVPPVGGIGLDDVLGQWQLPMVITAHRVAAPVDDGGGTPGCTDADGDGVCVEDGDCDDTDPQVYPGHNDSKGRWGRDGKDNDCNGIVDG